MNRGWRSHRLVSVQPVLQCQPCCRGFQGEKKPVDDVLKMKYYFNQHHSLSSSAFSPNDCRVRAGRGGCAGGLEAALTGDDFSAPRTATVSCLWTAGRKHIWSQTADPPRPPFTASPLTLNPPGSSLRLNLLFVSHCSKCLRVFPAWVWTALHTRPLSVPPPPHPASANSGAVKILFWNSGVDRFFSLIFSVFSFLFKCSFFPPWIRSFRPETSALVLNDVKVWDFSQNPDVDVRRLQSPGGRWSWMISVAGACSEMR